jgi:hypothetical protein
MVGWSEKYEDPRKYNILDNFVENFPEVHKEVEKFMTLDHHVSFPF